MEKGQEEPLVEWIYLVLGSFLALADLRYCLAVPLVFLFVSTKSARLCRATTFLSLTPS